MSKPLNLAAMAAVVSLSPAHLGRIFREATGMTPVRYLWRERVRFGVYLLEHTGLPVAEVALRSGFHTSYHFARAVRQVEGISPTQVRQRYWSLRNAGTPPVRSRTRLP